MKDRVYNDLVAAQSQKSFNDCPVSKVWPRSREPVENYREKWAETVKHNTKPGVQAASKAGVIKVLYSEPSILYSNNGIGTPLVSKEGKTIYQRRVATRKDLRLKKSWAENMSAYEVSGMAEVFRRYDRRATMTIDLRGWSDLGTFDVGLDPPDFFFMYVRKFHEHLVAENAEYFIANLTDYESLYMMRSLLKFLEGFAALRTAAINIG